jgi:hypothetical protein
VGSENDADNVPYPEGGGPLTQRLAAVDGRVKRLEAKKRADAEFAKPVGTVRLPFRASKTPPFPLFSCCLLLRFAHSGTAISFLVMIAQVCSLSSLYTRVFVLLRGNAK